MGIQTKPIPHCPDCGAQMALRKPKSHQDWKPFWGCSTFPECRGTRNILDDGTPDMWEEEYDPRPTYDIDRHPIDIDDVPF